MKNTPRKKYSEVVEQCNQALTIIILSVDLVLAEETLSQKGIERLETIKEQAWRIDKELKKGRKNENEY